MAAIDVSMQPGTPEPNLFPKLPNYTSAKATQDGLKRSFAKYLASEHRPQAVGKLFQPESHLQYEEPSYIHSMEEIGYSATSGVSPVAVSEPFRLFSEEAVNIMRAEIFDKEVQEKYSYTSDIAPKQLRGYAPE
jgi:hypothetical protein